MSYQIPQRFLLPLFCGIATVHGCSIVVVDTWSYQPNFLSVKNLAVGCYMAVCDLGEARARIFSYVIIFIFSYTSKSIIIPMAMHAYL